MVLVITTYIYFSGAFVQILCAGLSLSVKGSPRTLVFELWFDHTMSLAILHNSYITEVVFIAYGSPLAN